MTCCIVGKHPSIADIDRLIRAQQAAQKGGDASQAMSLTQIARTYNIRKATLFQHRDVCLADRSSVPVRGDGVPERNDAVPRRTAGDTDEEIANDSARVDRYAEAVPRAGTNDARGGGARATGPPASDHQSDPARARDPRNARRWGKVAHETVDDAAARITNAIADSELVDPRDRRAHASYVQEVVELINRMQWENDITVTRLARAWNKEKTFVLGCFRDACSLMRMARGTPNEDREVSLVRWLNLYKLAVDKGDPLSLKVASDALKGYDAASGIVDKSTRVQVNIAQDPQAQELVRRILVTLQQFPDALAAVRSGLASLGPDGDPTALLTTGEVAE